MCPLIPEVSGTGEGLKTPGPPSHLLLTTDHVSVARFEDQEILKVEPEALVLVAAESHLLPILEELARRNAQFRFHTPNALHAR